MHLLSSTFNNDTGMSAGHFSLVQRYIKKAGLLSSKPAFQVLRKILRFNY
jgi:hypothetical protein